MSDSKFIAIEINLGQPTLDTLNRLATALEAKPKRQPLNDAVCKEIADLVTSQYLGLVRTSL